MKKIFFILFLCSVIFISLISVSAKLNPPTNPPIGYNKTIDNSSDIWNPSHLYREDKGGINIINPPSAYSIMNICFKENRTTLGWYCVDSMDDLRENDNTDNTTYVWHSNEKFYNFGPGSNISLLQNRSLTLNSEQVKWDIKLTYNVLLTAGVNTSIVFNNISILNDTKNIWLQLEVNGTLTEYNLSKTNLNETLMNLTGDYLKIYSKTNHESIYFNWTSSNNYIMLKSVSNQNVTPVWYAEQLGTLQKGDIKNITLHWVDYNFTNASITSKEDRDYCDLNSDGYEDLVEMENSGKTFSVSLFNTTVNATNLTTTYNQVFSYTYICGSASLGVICNDFTNDGSFDIIGVCDNNGIADEGMNGAGFLYFFNNSFKNGTFGNPKRSNIASRTEGITTGDINQDGFTDIIHLGTSNTQILKNNGSGNFNGSAIETITTAVGGTVFDYNQDKKPDIAIALSNGRLEIYNGTGNGSMILSYTYNVQSGFAMHPFFYNNDSLIDLFVTSRYDNLNAYYIFTLQSDYNWTLNLSSGANPPGAFGSALTDFDNDQDEDLFLGFGGYIGIINNTGDSYNGNLSFIVGYNLTLGGWDVMALDIDNDGDEDIFSTAMLAKNNDTGHKSLKIRPMDNTQKYSMGARCYLKDSDGNILQRRATYAEDWHNKRHYCHFAGLTVGTNYKVNITWINGTSTELSNYQVNTNTINFYLTNSSADFGGADTTSPTWSNFNVNNTAPKNNETVMFMVNITDDTELNTYKFAHNKTGSFVNSTNITISFIGTYQVNVSINATKREVVCGYVWFNDTSGNQNVTNQTCYYAINSIPIFDQNIANYTLNVGIQHLDLDVNCSDTQDSETITYYDNSTMFNITSTNGSVYYTTNKEIFNETVNFMCGDNFTNATRTIYIATYDNTPPQIALVSPANNSNAYNTSVTTFQFNVNSSETLPDTCWLYSNYSGGFKAMNSSLATNGTTNSIQQTFYNVSSFMWNIYCNDTAGNYNFSRTNFTLNILANSQPSVVSHSINDTIPRLNDNVYFIWNATDSDITLSGDILSFSLNITSPQGDKLNRTGDCSILSNIYICNTSINYTQVLNSTGRWNYSISVWDNTSGIFSVITDRIDIHTIYSFNSSPYPVSYWDNFTIWINTTSGIDNISFNITNSSGDRILNEVLLNPSYSDIWNTTLKVNFTKNQTYTAKALLQDDNTSYFEVFSLIIIVTDIITTSPPSIQYVVLENGTKSNSFDTFIRLYTDSRENLNFTFNCTMDNRTSFNVDINYSNKLISYPLYNTTNPFNLWVNISPANGSMPNDVYYGWCNVSRIVDGFLRPVKIEWAQHPPSGQVAIYTGTTKCNSTSANCDFSDSILADEITTKSWTIKNDGNFTISNCRPSMTEDFSSWNSNQLRWSSDNFSISSGSNIALTVYFDGTPNVLPSGSKYGELEIVCEADDFGNLDRLSTRLNNVPKVQYLTITALSSYSPSPGTGGGGGGISPPVEEVKECNIVYSGDKVNLDLKTKLVSYAITNNGDSSIIPIFSIGKTIDGIDGTKIVEIRKDWTEIAQGKTENINFLLLSYIQDKEIEVPVKIIIEDCEYKEVKVVVFGGERKISTTTLLGKIDIIKDFLLSSYKRKIPTLVTEKTIEIPNILIITFTLIIASTLLFIKTISLFFRILFIIILSGLLSTLIFML